MRINSPRKRKAISPVLATVILIAITLIAAIAIAGFVFGLFGSFTSSAQVSARVISCTLAGAVPNKLVCTLALTNTGTSNTAITACGINVGGSSVASTATAGTGSLTINAGATDSGVLCTTNANQGEPAIGSQAVGSISVSNGASVPFSGVWS